MNPIHPWDSMAVRRLMAAGLIPPNTRTTIIKLTADDVVTIFYETAAEAPTLDALIDEVIRLRTGPATTVVTATPQASPLGPA